MQEYNELNFDPNDLKKQLEQNLGANIIITSAGNSKKEQFEKDEFMTFIGNLDMFLVNQELLAQDFGINMTDFLVPIHDANLYLMIKFYGELATEIILQFIENRDAISTEHPLTFVQNKIRYTITDLDDLYISIKMLQTTLSKKPDGRRKH